MEFCKQGMKNYDIKIYIGWDERHLSACDELDLVTASHMNIEKRPWRVRTIDFHY